MKAILKAIDTEIPKTRYPVGDARMAIMMNGLLGEKIFGKMMKSQLGIE